MTVKKETVKTKKKAAPSKYDTAQEIYDALLEYKRPEFARKALGITQRRFDGVVKDFQIPLDIGERLDHMVTISSIMFEEINKLTKEAVPDKMIDRIKRAIHHYDTDDLVGLIVRTQADFCVEGFHCRTKDEKDQKKIDAFNEKYDMDSLLLGLCHTAMQTDSMLLGWEKTGTSIGYVKALDPRTHIIIPENKTKNGVPLKKVYRKPAETTEDKELRGKVERKAKSTKEMMKKKKWELVRGNEFVEVRTCDGQRDRMVNPSMATIFADIELRKLYKDGDFTIAYHLKHMIHQIKVGEENTAKKPWLSVKAPSATELSKILDQYKTSDKTMLEVTSAFYKHEFVAPDVKYFDPAKYKRVENSIKEWGLIHGLFARDNQKYAGGYLAIKPLKAKIRKWRRIISRLLQHFYREALGVRGVSIQWDENNLLEPSQVLERLNAASEKGLSNKTFLDQLGFHSEQEVQQHRIEADHPEDYIPPFEPSQNITSELLRKKGVIDTSGTPNKSGTPGQPPDPNSPEPTRTPRPSEE